MYGAFDSGGPRKAPLRADLLARTYDVVLLSRVILQNGEEVDVWSARDAVVMKTLAFVLPSHLQLFTRCTHLKGHGGLKRAVREVWAQIPQHRFVLKTDVRSYYASIDHQLLLDRLLAKDVTQRLANSRELLEAIEKISAAVEAVEPALSAQSG